MSKLGFDHYTFNVQHYFEKYKRALKLSNKGEEDEPQKRIAEPEEIETPLDAVRKKAPDEKHSCEADSGVQTEKKVDE